MTGKSHSQRQEMVGELQKLKSFNQTQPGYRVCPGQQREAWLVDLRIWTKPEAGEKWAR